MSRPGRPTPRRARLLPVAASFLSAVQRRRSSCLGPRAASPVDPARAFNTAVSFVTNTNWQSYSGESTLGHFVQLVGLAVQNFVVRGVGIAVAVALIRGFARAAPTVGNFWVDLTRALIRVLLPLASSPRSCWSLGGVVQNLARRHHITTLTGGTRRSPAARSPRQEAIKELGTNGGGFFNANSAHPFENPTALTNLLEIFLLLRDPGLPHPHVRHDGRQPPPGLRVLRHGRALVASLAAHRLGRGRRPTAPPAGRGRARWRARRRGSASGVRPVRDGHDRHVDRRGQLVCTTSYTALGGGVAMLNMMLGEIAPGGVGAGLYGILSSPSSPCSSRA